MNCVARTAALEARGYGTLHATEFRQAKIALRQAGGDVVRMLATDDEVPICTLQHKNAEVDLQQLLYAKGVLTVSGADFEGLGANSVRVRIPIHSEVMRLVDAVALIAAE